MPIMIVRGRKRFHGFRAKRCQILSELHLKWHGKSESDRLSVIDYFSLSVADPEACFIVFSVITQSMHYTSIDVADSKR